MSCAFFRVFLLVLIGLTISSCGIGAKGSIAWHATTSEPDKIAHYYSMEDNQLCKELWDPHRQQSRPYIIESLKLGGKTEDFCSQYSSLPSGNKTSEKTFETPSFSQDEISESWSNNLKRVLKDIDERQQLQQERWHEGTYSSMGRKY